MSRAHQGADEDKVLIFKRSLFTLLSMLGLLILVFFLSRLTGDPAYLFLPVNATLEARQEFSELHGFNDPLPIQFLRYLWDLVHLDFGTSLSQHRSAMEIALEAFPTTLLLGATALTIAFVLAILAGALTASRPGGIFDRAVSFVSLAGAGAPDFWLAIVSVLIFSLWLDWLPTSGTGGPAYWIMPVGVLALRPFGLLSQVVRGAMIDALSSPHVKTAKAKGVKPRSIIFVHALRNAMLPVVTVAGDLATALINGAVIIETIFGWPGIGRLMINAIMQRDFAVIQAAILVTAAAIFLLNVVIDILYAVLDPRVRSA
jgi:peptide/nickel transport system permease protein